MDKNQQINQIEEEIRKTPYHKGTEHHIGKLRARIAKLKDEILFTRSKRSGGSGGGFAVRKTGNATVILIGPPSVGKSSLINLLTNAVSKVAAYDFTTVSVIPGIMNYKGAKIQILDVPGLITGAALNKGRGKEIISVVRNSDLIIMMTDIFTTKKVFEIKTDLYQAGIRLEGKPADLLIKKTKKGGLRIVTNLTLTELSQETISSVASEFKIRNAEIYIKKDLTLEQLIDQLIGSRVYLPFLTVINKIELNPYFYNQNLRNCLYISVVKKLNIEQLKEAIWQKLNFIRVYLKEKNKEPDFGQPFILKQGATLKELLFKISLCTKNSFHKAKIYGSGAKFPGQNVSLAFVPLDETIVSFS